MPKKYVAVPVPPSEEEPQHHLPHDKLEEMVKHLLNTPPPPVQRKSKPNKELTTLAGRKTKVPRNK